MEFILILIVIIWSMFLGNISYLMINYLPRKSENSLNVEKLPILQKDQSPFIHYGNENTKHGFLAYIPIVGYMVHHNKNIIKYEVINSVLNMFVLFLVYLFNRDILSNNIMLLFFSALLWSAIMMIWNVIFLVDVRHYIIPDSANLWLLILSLILWVFNSILIYDKFLWSHLISGVAIFAFFLILGIVSGGMGGGDVKFIISSGILFGPLVLFLVLIASLIGVLYRTILVPVFKLNDNKDHPEDIKGKNIFPFGPFLVIASYIILIFTNSFAILLAKYIEMSLGG